MTSPCVVYLSLQRHGIRTTTTDEKEEFPAKVDCIRSISNCYDDDGLFVDAL